MDSVDRRSMYLDDACSTEGGAGGRLCFAYGLALTLCHKAEPTAFEIDDIGIRMQNRKSPAQLLYSTLCVCSTFHLDQTSRTIRVWCTCIIVQGFTRS